MADAQIRITADTSQAERALGSLTSSLRSLAGIAIGGAIAKQFVDIADAATILTNKLKTVTNSSADAGIAFGEVARIAKLTGSNLGAVGDFFQKVALAGQGMGLSLSDTTKITENFSKALAVTGTVGPSAASAMYQFGQSLGRGTVMFEDMKQLQESSAGTLALIAQQFGKTSSQFLKDVQAGKVGSNDLANALKQLGDTIDPTFNGMQKTVGQSLENVRTEFVKTAQKFENATGFFSKLAKAIEFIGNNLNIVLPLVAAFVGAFAATRIIAIVTSLYEMVKVLRLIGTTGAVATALATGGLSAIAAAAGATAAYLAADKLFADMEKNEALKKQADEAKRLAEEADKANKALNPANKPLAYEGPKIDVKALAESASLYTKSLRIETQLIPLGSIRMAQEKAVLDFAKEQKIEYEKIAKTKIADQIRADVAANQNAKLLEDYRQAEKQSKLELLSLNTKDLDQRQEQLAVDQARANNHGVLTKEMEKQVRANSENARLTREALANEQQRNLLTGTATNQTRAERIGTATAVISESDPRLAMAQDYATKKRAIDEAIANTSKQIDDGSFNAYKQLIAAKTNLEDTYQKQKQIADIEFTNRELFRQEAHAKALMDLQMKVMNAKVEAANRALFQLDAINKQELANEMRVSQAKFDTANNDLIRQKRMQDQSLQNEIFLATAKIEVANKEVLARQAIGEAVLAMEQRVADARLKQAGVTNQAILDSIKQNQANVAMIQQGGIVGAQGMLGAFMSVTGQMSQTSKKAFEAHKAAATAQAIISTYQAAAMAIAMPPGPPLSFIYVAGAIAAGFKQIAMIRSQQYSGRALGGPVMGGKPYIVGERGPELFTPSTTGNITRNSDLQGGGVTNVNFTIVANDTTGFDQLLASRKGVIQQIISDAMLEKGRRSMV